MARLEAISLVALLVLLIVRAPALAQTAAVLDSPRYAEGDFWEYEVVARLDSLLGVGNISGSLTAEGGTRVEVTAVADGEATLSWAGDLTLQGGFTLPGETTQVAVSGTIETSYEERRQDPHFLPLALDAQAGFDVAVTLIVTVPYTATVQVNATIPPTASTPTYPIEVGDQTFTTEATLASNTTVDFLGMEFQNSTVDQVMSTIQWNVTSSGSVEVPAGTFSAFRVQMEATTGFIPSPFQALIPGAVQVTHHSPEVGSPVLFQFFVNGKEVGNASLETFSFASSVPPPFWQNPIFLGGLLAIPIALLLYRYWRERRKGL